MTSKFRSLILTIGISALALLGMVTNSEASSSIPKSWRGIWYSNITYTSDMKHVPANIAVPKVKMSVHSKTIYWRWYGTLGPHYNNRKVHKMKYVKWESNPSRTITIILNGHGPFREQNALEKNGSHLWLMYQGGNNIFHRK